jgi:hypothetical protein
LTIRYYAGNLSLPTFFFFFLFFLSFLFSLPVLPFFLFSGRPPPLQQGGRFPAASPTRRASQTAVLVV